MDNHVVGFLRGVAAFRRPTKAVILSLLVILSVVVIMGQVQSTSTVPALPPLPSLDSWYRPPSGWQSAAPGAILRSRAAPALADRLTSNKVNNTGASHLMYRTNDGMGNPAVAVVSVIRPLASVANSSRLLMYQPPYDSASNDCSPSYQFALENSTNPFEPTYEIKWEDTIFQNLLSQGYYVAMSDYETTAAAFTVGPTEGRAVLDAVTATLNSTSITGVNSQAAVQLLGYSGGATATEWAAELVKTYRPSLSSQIIGAAAGGLPANASAAIDMMNNNINSGLIPKGLVGLANGNSTFATALDHALKPNATLRKQFYSVKRCAGEFNMDNLDIWSTYFTEGIAFRYSHALQAILQSFGTMGQGAAPTLPMLFFQGCSDEVVGISPTTELVASYCGAHNQGSSITYNTFIDASHVWAAIDGMGSASGVALKFIRDRFDGVALASGCQINDACTK